ncbi:phenylalanine--tRNA ligase subunit beta [Candidatus Poribacteria bacterium]|nr:phenylalanine--tRNA ligase subunit beta [Candidatus Poribacteria bacterium]
MLVSLEWLKEYVDFDMSLSELSDKLTMVGLEVESIKIPPLEKLQKVVVGKIIKHESHPNADKLSLCTVSIGDGKELPIVCGAPNTRVGLISPLALEGAELPNGLKIKAAKIRGQVSHGMLCSEPELGLGDDASGIMELSSELEPGTSIIEALGLDNPVLELELTPNRSDCLSILGVAREVSAITGNLLKKPDISFSESDKIASDLTSVTIEAPDLCRRYAARLITGIKIGPSPQWICRRLNDMGLRPINNVVDVTNYVLMEFGHPLHAFDFDLLKEKRIIVRRADYGEHITTIDDMERRLSNEMLVIADAEKPVAVAGVMGGAYSEVSEKTTNILLESAYFNPVSISKTAKMLGMHTEASHRFERGTDIKGLITALDRTAQLIQELAGGEICKGIVDAYPVPYTPVEVELRPERVNSMLGTDISIQQMEDHLKSIEFQVTQSENNLHVVVPSFRPDVEREIDLIEEIARLYGYDNIPVTMPVSEVRTKSEDDIMMDLRNKARDAMVSCGLNEVINYSFHSPDVYDMIHMEEDSKYRNVLVIRNPISENQSVVRTTLIPVILENIRYNFNQRTTDVGIFEIGKVFHPKDDGSKQPDEPEFISGAITGMINAQVWNQPTRPADFYDIKGVVEVLMDKMDVDEYLVRPSVHPSFQPGRSAEIVSGEIVLGNFGEIKRQILDNYEFEQNVYIFEIDFTKMLTCTTREIIFQSLPVFPSVYRDMAVVLPFDIPASDVVKTIKEVGGKLIRSLNLFDVYKGKQIRDGMKSLAYAIEYFSPEETLTDEKVDSIHNEIVSVLKQKFNAELRK